jgi:hypothetical protein
VLTEIDLNLWDYHQEVDAVLSRKTVSPGDLRHRVKELLSHIASSAVLGEELLHGESLVR